MDVGRAIGAGWKPIELAQKLGVAPSFLSECIAELRTALGLVNGVFPTPSDDEYRSLLESIARNGVLAAIVVDEHGFIDGYQRARACKELARIVELADQYPNWRDIAELAVENRDAARELHGRDAVDEAAWLAEFGAELVELAREERWMQPPIERRDGLNPAERRRQSIILNAGRRHLQRGELRLLVEVELMLDGSRTNRNVASLVGCSEEWVRQIRHQLAEDEKLFAGEAQPDVETQVVGWRSVASLECPSCAHGLLVMRGGRDFALELTAGT